MYVLQSLFVSFFFIEMEIKHTVVYRTFILQTPLSGLSKCLKLKHNIPSEGKLMKSGRTGVEK